jgi:hypothetical protein
MKSVFLVLSLILLISLNLQAQPSPQEEVKAYDARSKSIVVPRGKGDQLVIDGKFTNGEWDDALSFPVSENWRVCLKVDSQALYIGLKAAEPVAIGVSEIRFTENGKDFYLLHVSARLGEGVSTVPGNTRFEMGDIKNWESNLSIEDRSKEDAWVAAGRPHDKYWEVIGKADGKEFKIGRKMFTGNRLKLTLGWMELAAKGKKSYDYPEDVSFENVDNWVELILPAVEH